MSVAVGQVYRSDEGRGKLRAEVVSIASDGRVRLFRMGDGGKGRVHFTLPGRFFDSPSCGWKLLKEHRGRSAPGATKEPRCSDQP